MQKLHVAPFTPATPARQNMTSCTLYVPLAAVTNLLSSITTDFRPQAQDYHQTFAPQFQYPRPFSQARDTFQGHRPADAIHGARPTYVPCDTKPSYCGGDYAKAYGADHLPPCTSANEIATAHQPYQVPVSPELNLVQQAHVRGAAPEPYNQAHSSSENLDPVSPIQCVDYDEPVNENSLPTGGYGYFSVLAESDESVDYNLTHADDHGLSAPVEGTNDPVKTVVTLSKDAKDEFLLQFADVRGILMREEFNARLLLTAQRLLHKEEITRRLHERTCQVHLDKVARQHISREETTLRKSLRLLALNSLRLLYELQDEPALRKCIVDECSLEGRKRLGPATPLPYRNRVLAWLVKQTARGQKAKGWTAYYGKHLDPLCIRRTLYSCSYATMAWCEKQLPFTTSPQSTMSAGPPDSNRLMIKRTDEHWNETRCRTQRGP